MQTEPPHGGSDDLTFGPPPVGLGQILKVRLPHGEDDRDPDNDDH